MGKAMILDKKITIREEIGPKRKPTKNMSLISAPPRLSFLNSQFPISIKKYIKKNANSPFPKE